MMMAKRNFGTIRRSSAVRWPTAIVYLSGLALALSGCSDEGPTRAARSSAGPSSKLLVIGMDGLDPGLLRQYIDEGRLPNFKKLAEDGCFVPLGTSMPPQSPVAWANFITGADPGTHQIYDFIHRKVLPVDPNHPERSSKNIEMYLSTSDVESTPAWYSGFVPETLPIPYTNWQMITKPQQVVLLRRGETFWDSLTQNGIDTTIYRMPANYPPQVEVKGHGRLRCLCGMGTPDIFGSYGTFTGLKEDMIDERHSEDGGNFYRLDVVQNRAELSIEGPAFPLRRPDHTGYTPKTTLKVEVVRDPVEPVVSIRIGSQRAVLKEGEWSEWLPVEFKPGLTGESVMSALGQPASIPAMTRVLVRQVHPNLDLYLAPMNIDPMNPANPISTPPEFAADIARRHGRYYTAGIPEDTKALRNDQLTEDEFLEMVRHLARERTDQYHAALKEFDEGFLFFYFGHTDQLSHIFWRDMDPQHPGRIAEQGDKYAHVIRDVYEEMDVRVGEARAALAAGDRLIIVSDHGFSSFRWQVNLNRWLVDNGFLVTKPDTGSSGDGLDYVDWSKSVAYAVGINSIYVNLKGREPLGIVDPADKRDIMDRIREGLLSLRGDDGAQVVVKMYTTEDDYAGADMRIAPDLLVGFGHNYRASWGTVLGGLRKRLIERNRDRWSGDHCIASYLVPGVFLSDRGIGVSDPALTDLAPTILGHFGVAPPASMRGRDLFGPAGGDN